jgi:hypothetical protein
MIRRQILFLLTFVCFSTFIGSTASYAASDFVVGKWIQEERNRDGCGNILYFYKNGSFSLHYGSILESRYRLQDDLLVETGVEPTESNVLARYIYRFEKANLVIQRTISYNPKKLSAEIVLTRANQNKPNVEPTVVGRWITYTKDGVGMVFEYTIDGKKLLYIPETVNKGTYTMDDEIISVTVNGSNTVNYQYVLSGKSIKSFNQEKTSVTYHKF